MRLSYLSKLSDLSVIVHNIIMPYSENDYLVKQNSILINEVKQKQDDRFID